MTHDRLKMRKQGFTFEMRQWGHVVAERMRPSSR